MYCLLIWFYLKYSIVIWNPLAQIFAYIKYAHAFIHKFRRLLIDLETLELRIKVTCQLFKKSGKEQILQITVARCLLRLLYPISHYTAERNDAWQSPIEEGKFILGIWWSLLVLYEYPHLCLNLMKKKVILMNLLHPDPHWGVEW